MCEQLLLFVEKYLPKEAVEASSAAAVVHPDGAKVLKGKVRRRPDPHPHPHPHPTRTLTLTLTRTLILTPTLTLTLTPTPR